MALERVRNYFGEAVAFYFAWLNFYTRSLRLPALIGSAVYLVFWLNESLYLTALLPAFAVVTMLWSSSFIEAWKAREALFRRQWNVAQMAEAEPARKGFRGELQRGFHLPDGLWVPMRTEDIEPLRQAGIPVLAPEEKVASAAARRCKVAISTASLLGMGLACVVTTLAILLVRVLLEGTSYGPYVTGGLNALAISVFNSAFRAMALRFNEWENHRRNSDFLNALVWKMAGFQFGAHRLPYPPCDALHAPWGVCAPLAPLRRSAFSHPTSRAPRAFSRLPNRRTVNCYFSLYYIMLVKPLGVPFLFLQPAQCVGINGKPPAGPDDPGRFSNCYEELQVQLLMIFVTNLVVGNLQELMQAAQARLRDRVLERCADALGRCADSFEACWAERAARRPGGVPVRRKRTSFERWAERGKLEVPPASNGAVSARALLQEAEDALAQGNAALGAELEERHLLAELEEQDDLAQTLSEEHGLGATFYEFNEMSIQFGYLSLFGVAFPPAALLALANNMLELRSDGFKLLYDSRRSARAC